MKLIYEDKKRVMTTALWQETDMCCSLYTIYVRKGDAWTYNPSS